MRFRKKLERELKKKAQEIEIIEEELKEKEAALREAKTYMQAIEDMMKHIPKEENSDESTISVRPGSTADQALRVLRVEGTSLHIGEILQRMGREVTRQSRQALSGQLSHYVRRNRVFTRTAPNTFGLAEWSMMVDEPDQEDEKSTEPQQSVPPGFGKIRPVTQV